MFGYVVIGDYDRVSLPDLVFIKIAKTLELVRSNVDVVAVGFKSHGDGFVFKRHNVSVNLLMQNFCGKVTRV